MSDGIPMDPAAPRPPSRRAKQRARRAKAQAEGQCVSPAKSTGKRCKNTPVDGRSTCRDHGGNGGRPIVHGRYSEELPERLRSGFLASLTDESLFDSTQTVALLDALVKRAAAMVAELDSPKFRERALEMVELVETLLTMDKDAGLAVHALAEFLRKGATELSAQERLYRLTERLDARIADANRIKLSKQNSINNVDLISVLQSFCATVQRFTAPELAKQILDEIEKTVGGMNLAPPSRDTLVGRN